MMLSNRNLLFQGVIFRCYVSFREGKLVWHLEPWNEYEAVNAFRWALLQAAHVRLCGKPFDSAASPKAWAAEVLACATERWKTLCIDSTFLVIYKWVHRPVIWVAIFPFAVLFPAFEPLPCVQLYGSIVVAEWLLEGREECTRAMCCCFHC